MSRTHDPSNRTRASLLDRIKDWNDRSGWEAFETTYGGLILAVARRHGLSEEEAEDVKQETLLSVAKGVREFEYDRDRCTFKTWLYRVTRNRIVDLMRRRSRECQLAHALPSGDSSATGIESLPDATAMEAFKSLWDEEWRGHVMGKALEELKERTSPLHFQVFFLHVVRGRSSATVAEALEIQRATVYLVKFRLLPQFRKIVRRLEAELS